MSSEKFYETYLFLNKDKIILSVIQNSNFKKIYEEKFLIDNKSNKIETGNLQNFLNNNIYKIEKKNKKFYRKNLYNT